LKTENAEVKTGASRKIGLIAGGGQFPIIFSEAAKSKGFAVYAAAYLKEADPDLKNHVDAIEWLHLGQISRLVRFFKKNGVREIVMMGAVRKTRMFSDVRPDIKAIALIASLLSTHDDGILRTFAKALEREGIQIREATFLLPELLAPKGCWTRRKPNRSELADIDLGWKLGKEVGGLDIGQCVVISGGSVLAVEAIEGTDAAITRGAKLGKGNAVVVKTCKPTQDIRFDIPAVGVQTIRTMHEAGAKVLVVETGKTVVFDRDEMIALANQCGISIVAKGDGKLPEPAAESAQQTEEAEPVVAVEAASTEKKLRVGVVGVGYLGKFHAEKYANMADADLVGVVDADPAQAEAIARKFGAQAYTDYKELLGKVDAVSIVVPTPAHFPVSQFFLENDVDVLIEKPMTTTLEEAEELIRIAESRGLIIQVGHLERFNPAVVALRDIIRQPMFIESHRLSLYKGRGTDVSVVLDLMIHDIDIILNFVKSDIRTIHASGVPVISEHVDIANARLEFENGCVANVTASRISTKNERKIRLFQRDGYMSVNFASRCITVIRQDEACDDSLIPGMDIRKLDFRDGDALEGELTSFVRAVSRREVSEVTGQMGRDALKIALSIMDQIAERCESLL